jgi:hypothetical protein
VPRGVGKTPRELYTTGGKLGVEFVRVVNEQIGVEEFVGILVRMQRGRFGASEVYSVVVTRYDRVHRRVLPGA